MFGTFFLGSKQSKYDKNIERFMYRHKFIAAFAIFIGIPIFILAAVFAGAFAVILPTFWVLGLI